MQTGELIAIDVAKERGIVLDESETQEKFKTRKIKMSFSDAVRKGLIDMTKGTFRDPESGKIVPVSTAIKDGLIDPERDER
ncbi:hypothetical protein NL518_28375, partial [Klebsiella pneumoniae]|nr:hypothetical protein [Klebsiella pneumoniae]